MITQKIKNAIVIFAILLTCKFSVAQWAGSTDSLGVTYRFGSVGIGTNTPSDKLQLYDDINGDLWLGINNRNISSLSRAGIRIGIGEGYDSGTNLYHLKNNNTFYISNLGDPNSKIQFMTRKTDGSDLYSVLINENGNVGIGTTNPTSKLYVDGESTLGGNITVGKGEAGIDYTFTFDGEDDDAVITWMEDESRLDMFSDVKITRGVADVNTMFRVENGSSTKEASLMMINNNSATVRLIMNGDAQVGSTLLNQPNGGLLFTTGTNGLSIVSTNVSGRISFGTGGTNNERMRITSTGNIGIGTTETFGYKLAVNGTIGTKEVIVETTSTWPDYVFEEDYDLPSLDEVEAFTKENKHLPNVPNQQMVKENGIAIGEMNAVLLKKIEELTLYMIETNKRLTMVETENTRLKDEIKKMKNQ